MTSVHVLRFALPSEQIEAFRDNSRQVLLGYPQLAMLGPDVRAELAKDFN